MSDNLTVTSEDDSASVRSSPVPIPIQDSNKKRAVSSSDVVVTPFRFMNLPDELRLKVYEFILPFNQRIFLDPENIHTPSPHAHEVQYQYDNVMTVLLISKKVHTEATEFIYTNNIVNIIRPLEKEDFLAELGELACKYITKLECHTNHGLVDLGSIWTTMNKCLKLAKLRLVFYHEIISWSKTLAQLAYYDVKNQPDLDINLELHTSIHPRPPKNAECYQVDFANHMNLAVRHDEVYTFELPKPLRQITVTASVTADAAYAFATFGSEPEDEGEFIGGFESDTMGMKTLTWSSRI